MQNRNKTAFIVNLVLILVGIGLIGYGIYYYTKPLPPFMNVTSADRSGSISAKDSADFLTAMSLSRPWDPTLANAAKKARQQADSEGRSRMLITALFVVGGIVLSAFGGVRIARSIKKPVE